MVRHGGGCQNNTSLAVHGTGLEFDAECLDAIDRGLDFIAKAIGEERRFIRSTGEVIPIGKIKKVSRESVVHLSRHSDLVREVDGDEVKPDKLFSAERLNDYATYENRFLCTLLNMIKEFLDDKYNLITRGNAFGAELKLVGEATASGKKLTVAMTVSYESENAPEDLIGRIDRLRQRTEYCLRTPLMVEAAKEDEIQYLTKTNVIRMDKNFSEAADLFEFLLSYRGDAKAKEFDRTIELGDEQLRQLFAPILLESSIMQMIGSGDFTADCLELEKELFERREAEMRPDSGAEEGYIKLLKDRIDELIKDNSRLIRAVSDAKKISANAELYLNKLDALERENERLAFELDAKTDELDNTAAELNEKLNAKSEKIALLSARLSALSDIDIDRPVTEEELDELEREFYLLGTLLQGRWNKLKAELKRRHLNELIAIMKGRQVPNA